MALAPGIWSGQREGILSGGCGTGKATGGRGQGSRGRTSFPRPAGRARGWAREQAPGPVRGTRGAMRDGEGRCGQGGSEARGARQSRLIRRKTERGAGGGGRERTPEVVGVSSLPRRGLGEMAEPPAGPAAAPEPVIQSALTRFTPRRRRRAQGKVPAAAFLSAEPWGRARSLGLPPLLFNNKDHFSAADIHGAPSSEGPGQAAEYSRVDWF